MKIQGARNEFSLQSVCCSKYYIYWRRTTNLALEFLAANLKKEALLFIWFPIFLGQDFSTLALLTFSGQVILCCTLLLHCKMFNSFPGVYLREARNTSVPSVLTTKNSLIASRGQNHPH